MSWRDLTDEEREALEPGTEGWKYRPGTFLAKGQWIEELREPETFKNGGVCAKIRWGSNGVGVPSMTLIGSAKNHKPEGKGDGYFPVPAGGIIAAQFGEEPDRAKLKPGEIAFGNIKGPLQKKAPKE